LATRFSARSLLVFWYSTTEAVTASSSGDATPAQPVDKCGALGRAATRPSRGTGAPRTAR
jgi:hypothetical protein